MASPNISELISTTLESRSTKIKDNVTKNNALLMRLKAKGKIRTVSGGRSIYETVFFAENGNFGWYSDYDTLSVAAQEVITSAEFQWKQCAVPVVISGREQRMNSGKEGLFDLLKERISNAEATMANNIYVGLYSDGTGSGGKSITGLDAAVPQDPTTGTYGGINRATSSNVFWRSQVLDPASTPTATTIQGYMNTLWAACSRGADRPDLIMAGGTIWSTYMASLQALQRFSGTETGNLGFPSIKFMDADVVLDGGIGGAATATDMYFLNTNYLHYRPHKECDMVPLGPGDRHAVNQDAAVSILGWMGNLTCSGAQFQGRLKGD
jgi:hypothetical protein